MEESRELSRKLKIENLEKCMNCLIFVTCREPFKEDLVDCGHHLLEEPESEQIVVVKLSEWCGKHD